MSPMTLAGDFLYISGQVAFDEAEQLVGEGDPEAQVDQVFANIARCLNEAGGGMSNLVHLRCFLTDAAVFPSYSARKAQLFEGITAPAATAVVVSALLDPRLLIEVEAVAYIPTKAD
jgi:enamine deaminase RidA (YjgF/YER057c/UK114 family)